MNSAAAAREDAVGRRRPSAPQDTSRPTGDTDAGARRHGRPHGCPPTRRRHREQRDDARGQDNARETTGREPESADPAEPVSGEPPRERARPGSRAQAPMPAAAGPAAAPGVATDPAGPGCDGGRTSPCPRRAVWRIRVADASAPWILACGIHLA